MRRVQPLSYRFAVAILAVLFIYIAFWRGMDDGKFSAFYSAENIASRDKIMRYLSIIIMYGSLVMISLYLDTMTWYIAGGVCVALCVVESILFFKAEKGK